MNFNSDYFFKVWYGMLVRQIINVIIWHLLHPQTSFSWKLVKRKRRILRNFRHNLVKSCFCYQLSINYSWWTWVHHQVCLITTNKHFFLSFLLRPNIYICVFGVTCSKKLGLVDRIFFFFFFFFWLFFFSIQMAYGTLKQNLVKLKYNEVIN